MSEPITCDNSSNLIKRIPENSYIPERGVYELNSSKGYRNKILLKRDIYSSQGHYQVNYAESPGPITIRLGPEREGPKNPELEWRANTLCNVLDFMISK